MPAGKHDHRAAIQTRTGSADAGGNVVASWTTTASRWAQLEDASGRELFRAQKNDATVDAVVTLREQYTGLSPEQRIVIDGRTFTVKAVLNKSSRGTRAGQVVHCKEVV